MCNMYIYETILKSLSIMVRVLSFFIVILRINNITTQRRRTSFFRFDYNKTKQSIDVSAGPVRTFETISFEFY